MERDKRATFWQHTTGNVAEPDWESRPRFRQDRAVRTVSVEERRARIGRRHALAGSCRVDTPLAAAEAMVVLHATEPASVHLAAWARCHEVTVDDVEAALHDDRTLVRQVAMRGTVFAFPRELLPAAWGSAAARFGRPFRTRLATDVERSGVTDDGEAWLTAAADAVLARLADGRERSVTELRAEVPEVDVKVPRGSGTWAQETSLAPLLATVLGVEGRIVRGRNGGAWTVSRPRWTPTAAWLGEVPDALDERAGYAELVSRWLRRFGPGTVEDVQWWLGGTKGAVRTALGDLDAVEVALDDGTGWLLRDDLDVVESPEPWVALLPVLDPTVMGWKQRYFYLGGHGPRLFDSVGNAGTTAWADGRIVGCWVQDDAERVRVVLLEDVPAAVRRALDDEAARLTAWLDGTHVFPVYPSAAMREAIG